MNILFPFLFELLLFVAFVPFSSGTQEPTDSLHVLSKMGDQKLLYSMRGEVRFLFFWVGRDNVGGGHISIQSGSRPEDGRFWKEVEVLFGSNPERVPGKVNLWGYGKERSLWNQQNNSKFDLIGTVFQGFMRQTKEYETSEIPSRPQTRNQTGPFVYEATRSTVLKQKASAVVHIFSDHEEFDYRFPDNLIAKYQEIVNTLPPDRQRETEQTEQLYQIPYGFLTGTWSLISSVVTDYSSGLKDWTKRRPSISYAYNVKPYVLTVRKIKHKKKFKTWLGNSSIEHIFEDVAEVQFRIENQKYRTKHNFILWFPLNDEMKGIPIRIVYQPKWWLRLRLDLTERKYSSDQNGGGLQSTSI
jgi:hypothetical protein